MLPKPVSVATSNVYVSGVDPVVTPFVMTSFTGCSTFLNCALSAGDAAWGAPTVTPVLASVTVAGVDDEAPPTSDGAAGLDFPHPATTSDSASALQRGNDFSFIQLLQGLNNFSTLASVGEQRAPD